MYAFESTIADWIQIVRGEYLEVPGLCLTKLQVQRLWGLDAATCETLLDTLVAAQVLRLTPNDTYVRVDDAR